MNNRTLLNTIALVLVIVGGINWGLVGLFRFDLVAAIFGPLSLLTRTIYTLVGLSAIYLAIGALNTATNTTPASI